MSLILEIAKVAPKGQPPGLFSQMKSPTMVGAYIIFHGDEGEPGPSIVMRRGQIIVMESSEQIRAFAEEHQLIQADIDEMLDMKSLARASTQLEQTIHYQGPST